MMRYLKKYKSLFTAAVSLIFLPFIYHPKTFDPVLLPRVIAWAFQIFCLIILFSQLSVLNKKNGYKFPLTPAYLWLSGYMLMATLSVTKAVCMSEAVFEIGKLSLFFTFLTMVVQITKEEPAFSPLIEKVAIISGSWLSIIGIGSWHFPRLANLTANPNLFASMLFLISALVLSGTCRFKGLWRYAGYLSLILMGTVIGLCRTRSVWIAILTGSTAMFLFGLGPKKKIKHTVPFFLLLVATGTTVFCIMERSSLTLLSSNTLKVRIQLWESSIEMIRAHPLLGVGPGQWRIHYPLYTRPEASKGEQKSSGQEIVFQRPHNDFLWVFSENGVPAGMCYIAFFIFLLLHGLKIVRYSSDTEKATTTLCMLYGLSGYLVIAFLSFPKERACHLVSLSLIAGSIMAQYRPSCYKVISVKPVWLRSLQMVITGMVLFIILSGLIRMTCDIHAKKAARAMESEKWEAVLSESYQAESLFYHMDGVSNPVAWYRGTALLSLNQIDCACQELKKALKITPWHVHSLNNLGVCYVKKKEFKKASRYFRQALKIKPTFQAAEQNLESLSIR